MQNNLHSSVELTVSLPSLTETVEAVKVEDDGIPWAVSLEAKKEILVLKVDDSSRRKQGNKPTDKKRGVNIDFSLQFELVPFQLLLLKESLLDYCFQLLI